MRVWNCSLDFLILILGFLKTTKFVLLKGDDALALGADGLIGLQWRTEEVGHAPFLRMRWQS